MFGTVGRIGLAILDSNLTIASLLPVKPSAIVWACTSGSFYGGRAWHDALLGELRARAGAVPVSTAYGFVVDALRALGIARPAVGTPHGPDISRWLDVFLTEHGLGAHPTVGYYGGVVDDYAPQEVDDDDIADFLARLDRPDCDGIVLSCTGLPSARIVAAVEARIGKPVVTSNQAILWNALRLGVVAARLSIAPRLLSTLPAWPP
ncbi:MAG: aspartate/glutamate racemase family protein [Alphaproteobacteria bacterium]